MPSLVAVALAVAMTWPLSLHLRTHIAGDLGDPLFFTWQLSWIGHATFGDPLDLWQANIFWPLPDSLAFTDTLLGYAPAAFLADRGLGKAIITYNLLLLFALALTFLGTYLLARELGTGRLGGLCAGAAFTYAPWLVGHIQHLPIRSAGGIPLALYLLVRGYRRRSGRMVLAGWVVAAWQMLLGLALGLSFAYLVAILAVLAVVLGWRNRRELLTGGLLTATIGGVLVLGLATVLHVFPYLRVTENHPESARSIAYVTGLSPTWRGFLAAPEESTVWGDATERARAPFRAPSEQSLFPGVTVLGLAVTGALGSVYPRRLRRGLVAATVAAAVLSVGIYREDAVTPYRVLYELAPGWDAVRTSGRINLLTSLGLALLAAAGVVVVTRWLARRVRGRPRLRTAPTVVGLALVAAILVEGHGQVWVGDVPEPPAAHEAFGGPRLHLPGDISAFWARYIVWSTEDLQPIVNGYGSFEPTENLALLASIEGFPDAESVERLQEVGVRTVVLHREFAAGTPWESVVDRPIDDLPLTREVEPDVIVYRLAP